MHLDWWTLALQTVNFAILVWLLQHFLYKPVLRMIDARKAEIQGQYDTAKAAEEKAQAQLREIAAARAGIAAERGAALKAAVTQAEEAARKRRSQAEADANALLDETRKTLAKEREQALETARAGAVDLGLSFATRLLSEVPVKLRAEAWLEHVEAFLTSLPGADLAALSDQLVTNPLSIVSAAALPAETAEAWRTRLRNILGKNTAISFEVDSSLVAGVDLHFPTSVLRFSWQSALASMRTEI